MRAICQSRGQFDAPDQSHPAGLSVSRHNWKCSRAACVNWKTCAPICLPISVLSTINMLAVVAPSNAR